MMLPIGPCSVRPRRCARKFGARHVGCGVGSPQNRSMLPNHVLSWDMETAMRGLSCRRRWKRLCRGSSLPYW